MRAELKSLEAAISEPNLEAFRPADPEDFGFHLYAFFGPSEAGGQERFHFFVCSPGWIADQLPDLRVWFFGNHLLMTRWDYGVLLDALHDLCDRTQAPTWEGVVMLLSRYGHWDPES